MKLYYDLHIHSILSPCADELMTPNNILNMAMLKKLDIVAITDHNSTRQLPTIRELENSYDFLFVPAVEVTVQENFDVLCYFRTYEDAAIFNQFLAPHLLDDWGTFSKENQVITDVYDNEIETVDTPLTKTNIAYKDLVRRVRSLNGALILAHIDRPSQTPLQTYDLADLDFDAIELQGGFDSSFVDEHPYVNQYRKVTNSDAHSLAMISEQKNYIELEEKSIKAFFSFIRGDQ